MSTAEATAPHAALPLQHEIAALRAQLAAAEGHREVRGLLLDVAWAEVDRARELQADPTARALAVELADAGDEDAIAALRLAAELPPLAPPKSAGFPDLGALSSSGASFSAPQLRAILAQYRTDGLDFARAWQLARDELHYGDSGPLAEILRATEPAWAAAYRREPAPRGFALARWGLD